MVENKKKVHQLPPMISLHNLIFPNVLGGKLLEDNNSDNLSRC